MRVVKTSQWMKTIGVGRMSASDVKEGHEQELVYNAEETLIVSGFLSVCAIFKWREVNWVAIAHGKRRYTLRNS